MFFKNLQPLVKLIYLGITAEDCFSAMFPTRFHRRGNFESRSGGQDPY